MKIAYCDCFSGISGDMFLAALLDAGLPLATLKGEIGKLGLVEPFEISVAPTQKGAIRANLLDIQFSKSHHHRNLRDIQTLLTSSDLSDGVVQRSLRIFTILAESEANVHGVPVEQVHFHEVGALDSIIDIVGAAIGLEFFGIEQLYSSALPVGTGQVKTEHGLLPLPAPATLDLMRRGRMTIVPSPAVKELVTPTGAAILTAYAKFELPTMRLERVGIGAGKRELPWPNIFRLMIGESEDSGGTNEMVLIETNIDDMPPQLYAPVQARLFQNGALDVYLTPIQMKKNRPAVILSVIARKKDEANLAQILLRETTTFGVRVNPIRRYEAERQIRTLATRFGEIRVKVKILDGKPFMAMPEYEDCLRRAEERGVPVVDVYQAALAGAAEFIQG